MTTKFPANARRKRSRNRIRLNSVERLVSQQARLIVLCAFLLVVFLTGGSSRADVGALVVLRPISLLVLGYGLLTLSRANLRAYWPLVAVAACTVGLTLLHLVPLPSAIWLALPGRDAIAEIDSLLGFADLWRPLTLDPQATRNALMALATPCAVLVLAIQLDRGGHRSVLTFTLGIGALSALWALLQLMGNSRGPLYLYELTSYGAPVGLFANRNHQAAFLASLTPLVYCWVQLAHGSWKNLRSDKGRRSAIGGGGILLLVPLILIAGSRAGLLALAMSICATAALVAITPAPQNRHRRSPRTALTRFAPIGASVIALAGLAVVTIGLGRDRAFERLIGMDPAADTRAEVMPAVWRIAVENLPWGAGIGSFDDTYRMYEADSLLMPEYVNHAHNDLLEIFMGGGVIGILIITFGVALFGIKSWSIVRGGIAEIRANILPTAALTALAVLFIASLVDYPLRTPAMASYAVLLAIWASNARSVTTS